MKFESEAPTGCYVISRGSGWWKAAGAPGSGRVAGRDTSRIGEAALEPPAFQAVIDPNDASFLNPVDMPGAIADFCRATGQTPPDVQAPGEVMRCVLESLALAYRQALERTEALTGHRFPGLHVVRGGTRNEILLQFTADAIGRPISSGPTEATAIGNLLGQLMASGHIASLRGGRALVRESFPIRTVEPGERGKGGTRRFIGDGPSFFLSPYHHMTPSPSRYPFTNTSLGTCEKTSGAPSSVTRKVSLSSNPQSSIQRPMIMWKVMFGSRTVVSPVCRLAVRSFQLGPG